MRNLKFNKRVLSLLGGGALLAGVFLYTQAPVNSVSTVTLQGTAASTLALTAGTQALATLTGGGTGPAGSITAVATDTADGFNDTVNYGTLSAGDGTNEVAQIPLRVRGNSACHVSWKVTNYTAQQITYGTTALTGSATSSTQLSFITLGTNPMAAGGANASTAGGSYQASFLNGKTIDQGNSGNITASVASTDEKLVSFTTPPSLSGSITNATNYVEIYPTFSVPTGFAWQATGASPSWSCVVSFLLASGS